MKLGELCSYIAKQADLKCQISIANIREIVTIIGDVFAKDYDTADPRETYKLLLRNGIERKSRK